MTDKKANTSNNILKELKKKLEGGSMSVLVGAGFSKNVSPLFPSWSELLFDMAKEMFESDTKDAYAILKATKTSKTKLENYENYLNRKIENQIKNVGYLQLVSNYIKQKGYREIIEAYIEQRTPKIIKKNGSLYIEVNKDGKITQEILKEEQLILHNKLIELPWNNIYTTNYDHLLEISADDNIHKSLLVKINELNSQIEQKEKQRIDDKEKLEKINEKIKINDKIKNKSSLKTVSSAVPIDIQTSENIDSVGLNGKWKLENDIKSADYLIKENNKKIDKLQNLVNQCLSLVTHSSELALKRNKNIIKLHGTLRNKDDNEFGFDSDPRKHYVISKEDFDTYPQTHEAFTQLMRISLLQESYCLIGFSGVDPNFLAWIGWVRDIIQRRTGNVNLDDKIYLIEVTKDLPSQDKKLFYKNHRIGHIPLLDSQYLEFLESETGKKIKDKTSRKDALLLLTEFLNDGLHINKPKSALELLEQEEYKKLWSEPAIHDPNVMDINILLAKIPKIEKIKRLNRIPSVNFAYSHNKHSFLHFSKHFFDKAETIEQKVQFLKLYAFAIDDQFLPYSIYNDNNFLDPFINKVNKGESSFIILQIKDAIWRNNQKQLKLLFKNRSISDPQAKQEIIYQKALSAAFNFDFSQLKIILSKWKPIDHWILKKAGLLVLYNLDEAINLISENPQKNIQEQLYSFHMLNFFKRSKDYTVDKHLSEKIKYLENEGLKTVDENINYLIEEINKKKQKIKPYGEGKFSIGRSWSMSNTSTTLQSIQFIGILIESGFPLSLQKLNLRNSDETYAIIKNVFKYFPFPTLYYVLQYGETDFLKRVGQDYAYSEDLKDEIEIISKNLQRAYFDNNTPSRFKESILIFYSELLIVLKPILWEDFLIRVWNEKLKHNQLFVDLIYKNSSFVKAGLRYIKKPQIISKIIIDCIDNLEKEAGNSSVEYLYELAHNYWVEKSVIKIKNFSLQRKIGQLIQNISTIGAGAIFSLGNIYPLLGKSEKAKILKKFYKLDFDTIANERVWHVILYYANGDPKILNKVKQSILKHPQLWNSGITETGGSNPYSFISLNKLRKNADSVLGIEWSYSEKQHIFKRLKEEFNKIKEFVKKRDDIMNYASILEEMVCFLEDEMKRNRNVNQILSEIKLLYFKQRGFKDIIDGITSNDQSNIIWALNEVSKDIYQNKKIGSNATYISIVLDKLLIKSEPTLAASLRYITNWIYDYKDEIGVKKFGTIILKIINKYTEDPPENIDFPFLQENLIKLAYVLQIWGFKDDIVIKKLKELNISRFNNLRALNDIIEKI